VQEQYSFSYSFDVCRCPKKLSSLPPCPAQIPSWPPTQQMRWLSSEFLIILSVSFGQPFFSPFPERSEIDGGVLLLFPPIPFSLLKMFSTRELPPICFVPFPPLLLQEVKKGLVTSLVPRSQGITSRGTYEGVSHFFFSCFFLDPPKNNARVRRGGLVLSFSLTIFGLKVRTSKCERFVPPCASHVDSFEIKEGFSSLLFFFSENPRAPRHF